MGIKHKIFSLKKSNLLFPFLIIAIYLISRIVFYIIGINFDSSGLETHWQYLDISILKHDLIKGVYYQHSQPPFFNIFLGVVLKLFPENYEHVFAIFYYFCGFTIYYLIYKILRLVKFNSWMAFGIATIFIITPEAILFENWLFYTWPVATLLIFSVYELFLYEKTLRLKNGFLFLTAIGIVCLSRSMFHLLYMIGSIVLILSIRSPNRKIISILSISVLLLVGSIFIKNFVLYGFFSSSSWMGMNLWKIAPHSEVSTPTDNSNVTDVTLFSPISNYPDKYLKVPMKYSEIPVLTTEYKQNGTINLNHYGYISVSQAYLNGAVNLILNDFSGYLKNVIVAWGKYCRPAKDNAFVKDNRNAIQSYIDVISFTKPRFYIEHELFGIKDAFGFPISSLLIIPFAIIMIIIYFIINIIKFIYRDASLQQIVFLSFMVLTILYVAVIGNTFESGENERFRVQTDPILYLVSAITIRDIWKYFRNKIKNYV